MNVALSILALLASMPVSGVPAAQLAIRNSNCKATKNWVREEGSIDTMGSLIGDRCLWR